MTNKTLRTSLLRLLKKKTFACTIFHKMFCSLCNQLRWQIDLTACLPVVAWSSGLHWKPVKLNIKGLQTFVAETSKIFPRCLQKPFYIDIKRKSCLVLAWKITKTHLKRYVPISCILKPHFKYSLSRTLNKALSCLDVPWYLDNFLVVFCPVLQ